MMIEFIHKKIMGSSEFQDYMNRNSFSLHEQTGTRVFFHDCLIERWRHTIEFDIVTSKSETVTKEGRLKNN